MEVKDALTLTLDQIISRLDTAFYLNDANMNQTQLEIAFIRNEFNENTISRPTRFSGIYEIERAYTLMHRLIIDKESMIESIDNVNTKNLKALEAKEKELDTIFTVSNNYIMNISSIIDTATYNNCQILRFEEYNYFGFNKNNYKILLQSAQYRSTSSVLSDKVFYELFTGQSIIGEYYTPIFSMHGVINKVPRDKLEYRIHRLICLLVRMDRRELASVLCRLLLTQLEMEERVQNVNKA
ncbi:hypothetical protein [Clostridium tertium]|uniref:hypothetical protein n=1 Tax=Clostridium tertium TaxID=1559 RepID=UPI0023B33C5F|nr:hypothetical protein [Clostridium tertium]